MFIGLASSLSYYTWLLTPKLAHPGRVAVFLALGPITATTLAAAIAGS
jgi:drug/metabolite transporter (DMT)-like permease